MRICSVLTTFTAGGAETLVENLSTTFAARGHEATVLSLSDAAQVGNPVEVEQQMRARLEASGVGTRSMALANRRKFVTGAVTLRKALQAIRPDVIHCHTAGAVPMLGLAGARVPVVLTHHNSRLSFPPQAYWIFDRIVSRYVAISQQCEAQTRRHARRPVRTILNAANSRFQAARPRTAPAQDPVILAVGTPSEQKDYATLVQAAVLLRNLMKAEGRQPLVRIVGGGALVEDLREMVRQAAVSDIVDVTGARSDVDTLMREADVFVNSSLWEGFPIAMIEASMSALPIIATEVAGNREMVTPGINGILVPRGNPEALASAIANVLSDPALYSSLSKGSLASAERFSIDRCADEHLALYGEIAGARRSDRGHSLHEHSALRRDAA
ncbi:glycosyltransferase family 4 protein [Novosphingobium sp. M1R2S20]|uniref:Glycosyltransferase family 4 protein n=1 Tax=Novosphingobium rhizovicinum TaxID=3228928 RepID=A0ABV3RGC7_9SPHN